MKRTKVLLGSIVLASALLAGCSNSSQMGPFPVEKQQTHKALCSH